MAQTNVRLALASYALSGNGTCGFSAVALSYPMSAPSDFSTFVVALANDSTVAPIHVEMRSVWTANNGFAQTMSIPLAWVSNPFGFGGTSAVFPQTLAVLASGKNMLLPVQNFVGSSLQVVVLFASNTASTIVASGQISLWATQ